MTSGIWTLGLAVLLAFFSGVVVGVMLVFVVGWRLGRSLHAASQAVTEAAKPRAPASLDVELN